MKRITDLNMINRSKFYHVVVFTKFGVLTCAVLPGYDVAERMKDAKYEKQYDMFFYPGDPDGYDLFEQEDY